MQSLKNNWAIILLVLVIAYLVYEKYLSIKNEKAQIEFEKKITQIENRMINAEADVFRAKRSADSASSVSDSLYRIFKSYKPFKDTQHEKDLDFYRTNSPSDNRRILTEWINK